VNSPNNREAGDPVSDLTPEEYRTGAERIAADMNRKLGVLKRMLVKPPEDTTDALMLIEEMETAVGQLLNPPS